ncbi:MAG: hypothetical protein AAF714_12600 [Pseudomonadota bacterium]
MRPQSFPLSLIVLGIVGAILFNDILDVLALTFVRPGQAASELPMRMALFFFVVTLIGYRLRTSGMRRITEWAEQFYAPKPDPKRLEIDPEAVLRKTMSGQTDLPSKTQHATPEGPVKPALKEHPTKASTAPKPKPRKKDRSPKTVSELGPKRNDRFADGPIVSRRRGFFS